MTCFIHRGLAAFTLCCAGVAISAVAEQTQPPNILFLFTDDQRFDTIHGLGNDAIKTPYMDTLVKEGTAFRNAYIMGGSSPAVCSPSRASLFSGRTLWNLENQGTFGFEISEAYKTLPQVFRENGYITFATGKNEPGKKGHFARSFSTADKILFRGMSNQYNLPLHAFEKDGVYEGKKSVMHKGQHSAEVYADACIRFLESQKESTTPFFAYVAFQTPHDPRTHPKEYKDMYTASDIDLPQAYRPEHPFDNGMLKIRDEKLAGFPRKENEVQKHIADYYATITHTDAQIGRILDALRKTGRYENSIIVFTSDNGLAIGRHGLLGKQNIYDHSVHVPLIIAGPGVPRGETRDQLCYIYDLYPTLCEKAGLEVPDSVQFISLNPLIKNKDTVLRNHLYFAFMNWQRGIRTKQYKLIEYCVDGTRHTQLFNMAKDPIEMVNLAGNPEYKDILNDLRKKLQQDRKSLNDGRSTSAFTTRQGTDFWNTYDTVDTSVIP